jgi:putative RecB family exonuclease
MPVYSHSSLSLYENCPLAFKYCYIDRVEVLEEKIETFLGSRVHEALQKLYQDLRMTKKLSLDELLKYYDFLWEKNWLDSIIILHKEYGKKDYKELGKVYLSDYYQRYHPFDQGKTLGLEELIFINLEEKGIYKIKGYIDRITEVEDGEYEIHDYKTNKRLPSQEEVDKDRQLALYQIGIEKKWREIKNVDLIWHFLHFDKELRSTRKKEDLNLLCQATIKLIDEIEKAKKKNNFSAKESPLCDWCNYQRLCPKRKHFFLVEEMPVNQYLSDSGVELVNKYVEIKHKMKKLEEERDQLEQAIFAFAKENDLEVIRGSDNKVKIKCETKIDLPLKSSDPETWQEIETLIRKAGRWEEVSKLDRNEILKKITEENWDKALIEKLRKYLVEKEEKRIYPSALRDKDKIDEL